MKCICRFDCPENPVRIPVHEAGARPTLGRFPDTSLRTVEQLDASGTVTIDDPENGGSEDGAWREALAGKLPNSIGVSYYWRDSAPEISGQFGSALPSGPLVRAFPDPGQPHRAVLTSAGVALSLDVPMLRAIITAAQDGLTLIKAQTA